MTRKKHFIFTFLVTLLFMSLSACSGVRPAPAAPAEEPVDEKDVSATEVVSVTSEPVETNYCLECHTDKDRLISTAKAEEKVVSENEGEG